MLFSLLAGASKGGAVIWMQFYSVCENCFCHNLNKEKYAKVRIFRKGISQGISLNRQTFS